MSALKRKNLLLLEQILSFNRRPLLEWFLFPKEAHRKSLKFFPSGNMEDKGAYVAILCSLNIEPVTL